MERSDANGDEWIGLLDVPLPVGDVSAWAALPDCGAVVVFTGTVRDHSAGRPGVSALDYEAYEDQATARISAIVGEARRRWPATRRVACLHRLGTLKVGEAAVVVAVSAPHRCDAFDAARWCIDTVKDSVPIWKRETWESGSDWGLCAERITDEISSEVGR